MMKGSIFIQKQDTILLIYLNRPDRANALDSDAHFQLSAIFDAFEKDNELRVAIITGVGDRYFCAGNDLKHQAEGGALQRPETGFAGITHRFSRNKPLLAAVNGAAAGGGCEIVASCDLAIADSRAKFSFPEVRSGLVPSSGIHLLLRSLHVKDALGLLLTGSSISADEALRIGLINLVVGEGQSLEKSIGLAKEIAACSPSAVRTTLDIARQSRAIANVEEALSKTYDSLEAHRRSSDFVEGPLAFAQKRKPVWED